MSANSDRDDTGRVGFGANRNDLVQITAVLLVEGSDSLCPILGQFSGTTHDEFGESRGGRGFQKMRKEWVSQKRPLKGQLKLND
jgi:hypothetical protein